MDRNLRELYESIKDKNRFVQPYWLDIQESLAQNIDLDNFLNQREILDTMNPLSCSDGEIQIVNDFVKTDLIVEPDFGGRQVFNNGMSANFIRQMHHIIMYEFLTHEKILYRNRVIEWGGGYGLMAYICNMYVGISHYTIVDLPIFTVLQYHYLSNVLGKEAVAIWPNNAPITLVPVGNVDYLGQYDMFISTWALSESSQEAIDYVKNKSFFGTKKILTAFQGKDEKFPYAENFSDELSTYQIAYTVGNNYYGFL